jgi:ornithine cyclodeaminase/alanine dehydrogenase-like protein (mu-crystallin family)
VFQRDWLRPGTHVNSVGYNTQGSGEVDRGTVDDAYVVIESRASALAPPPAGAVELRHVDDAVEIGEIAAGRAAGRTSDDQLTLYKSVGVAVQDAAAANHVLHAARERGLGTDVPL